MPQFAVHRNRNAATKARFPLLLDVQSDLLEELGTRVVIPLTPASSTAKRTTMRTLMPVLAIENREYLLVTPQLAGIAAKELGPVIADLSPDRTSIVAALDLLITGI
ncbi:MAG TPA: CcdB family protein [Steroidobacteraceae bacterium]|nr:CcdB family protein [Steroidobacteraceae bacterium]